MQKILSKQSSQPAGKKARDVASSQADAGQPLVSSASVGLESQMIAMNKTMATLNSKTGDGLNSNVIKLTAHIKKQNEHLKGQLGHFRSMNKAEVRGITDSVMGRRQYNTLKPRIENFKEGFKDFFTMRGFLDKTGIVKRKSGGIFSEYLDRAEDRKKYVEQRMKVDPTARLLGDKKARETFSRQFNEQQKVEFDMRKNQKVLKEMKDNGFTEEQIKRSKEYKKSQELATQMAKVDPRLRPKGFDPKTGKILDDGEESEKETKITGTKKKKEAEPAGSAFGAEEAMLEQNKKIDEQTDLLIKIEENTRGGGKGGGEGGSKGDGGGGLLDGLLGMGKSGLKMAGGLAKGAGRFALSAGKSLLGLGKTVGMGLLQRAGPIAAITAAGAGIYAGYSKYKEAKQAQEEKHAEISQKVKSGEITPDEGDKLKEEANKEATVDKAGAIGTGAGQAIGGVAGALKGAAVGAAIGSAVPIVGTVIGGAIGATVGAIGGSYLGNKIGGAAGRVGGHVVNAAKGLWKGAKDMGSRLMGWGKEKVDQVKDVYNRGNTGTAKAAKIDEELHSRAYTAGAVDEEGNVTDPKKYNEIRNQLTKELNASGDGASGTIAISASGKLEQNQVAFKDGKTVETSEMNEGTVQQKSVLGSTLLGKFFAAKDTETGGFLGTRELQTRTTDKNGKEEVSTKMGRIMGKRVSGGFFGSDKHTVTDENGNETEVTAWEYRKLQNMIDKGDNKGAAEYLEKVKAAKENPLDKTDGTGLITNAMGDVAGSTAVSLDKASAENEKLKIDSVGAKANTNVVAPTVNNVNNTTKNEIKAPIRNQESAQKEYTKSRYAWV